MLLIFLKLKLEVQSNSNISVMPDSISFLNVGSRSMLKVHLAGFDVHMYIRGVVIVLSFHCNMYKTNFIRILQSFLTCNAANGINLIVLIY